MRYRWVAHTPRGVGRAHRVRARATLQTSRVNKGIRSATLPADHPPTTPEGNRNIVHRAQFGHKTPHTSSVRGSLSMKVQTAEPTAFCDVDCASSSGIHRRSCLFKECGVSKSCKGRSTRQAPLSYRTHPVLQLLWVGVRKYVPCGPSRNRSG